MEELIRDLRYATRMLVGNPSFTLIAVLSLALGIGANSTIFSLINEVFLRPLPITEPGRVMAIFTDDERAGGQGPMSHLNWRDVRELNETFEQVAGYDFVGVALSSGGEPAIAPALMVSGNYFDTLGIKPLHGRFFLPDEDATPGAFPVVVIHHQYWIDQLGADPAIVGKTLTINGQSYGVVGVAPPEFDGLTVGFEPALWIPMAMNQAIRNNPAMNWYQERRGLFLFGFGRLRAGVSPEQALANLTLIAQRLEREYPDDNKGRGITIQPIAETTVFNRGGVARGVGLLMATVGIVLLIACANVANLLLARASERRREVAIRLAMGIARGRLVRQLLTESVMVSLLGGATGLTVAYLSRGWLGNVLANLPFGGNLAIDLALDVRVLGFALALSIATGLLFGLLPAIQSSRPGLVAGLRDDAASSSQPGRKLSARNALVVVQLALSLVALVGAGLFVRSLSAAQEVDLGYPTDRLVLVGFDVGLLGYRPEQGEQFFRDAAARAAALPGVDRVALAQGGPLQGTLLRSVFPEGRTTEERTFVQVNAVGPGYFETLGVAIENGRPFDDTDRSGSVPVVVINRTMADKYWPAEEALGKRFHFFGMEPVEIVGIAETVKVQNPGEDPQPYAYLPLWQHFVTNMNLLVRTQGDPSSVLLAVQGELRRMEPNLVLNADTASNRVRNVLAGQRFIALFLAVFGGIALVLSAIGIYGVMSYLVRRRTREIGIRMALGAERSDVLGMVLREGMTLAAVGLGVGVILALGLTRLLTQLLFVSPNDPVAFGVTLAVLLVVALLACLRPAWRAASLSPTSVLRYS